MDLSKLYASTSAEGEMLIDLNVYKAMTGKEFHGQKIPVHISDDNSEKYNTQSARTTLVCAGTRSMLPAYISGPSVAATLMALNTPT